MNRPTRRFEYLISQRVGMKAQVEIASRSLNPSPAARSARTSQYANVDNECMFKVKIFVDVSDIYIYIYTRACARLRTRRNKKKTTRGNRKNEENPLHFFLLCGCVRRDALSLGFRSFSSSSFAHFLFSKRCDLIIHSSDFSRSNGIIISLSARLDYVGRGNQ